MLKLKLSEDHSTLEWRCMDVVWTLEKLSTTFELFEILPSKLIQIQRTTEVDSDIL